MNRNIAPRYAPKRTEDEISQFWEENKAYERSREKRSHGQETYLLDSPHGSSDILDGTSIYSLMVKDTVIRYLRMRGYNVRDIPGINAYEGSVEKRALEALDMDESDIGKSAEEYIRECRKQAKAMGEEISKGFLKFGVWMDWKKAYTPVDSKYMEGVWFTFEKLNSKGLLGSFRGVSQWCPTCKSFLPKSEIKVEKEWKKGVYVKFPLKNKKNTYLITWFSEPWRLTATLALEVSPSKRYSIIDIKGGREKIILGSDEAEQILNDCGIKNHKKTGEISGEKLVNARYIHPLFEHEAQDEDVLDIGIIESSELKIDRVLSGTSTGRTGIRALVPAHSNYDLNLAEKNGLQALSPISDTGELGESTGKYKGFNIFNAESIIIRDLINTGMALSAYDIMESTGYCRKCNSRTIPMMSEEWSFKPSDVGDALESTASEVEWVPSWMMGADYDWMEQSMPVPISRNGYWGVPMPVWICSCGHTEIIGSSKELEKLSPEFKKGMGLHRPWVDHYTLKCPKCGGTMRRVKEVLLPDFSAMAASWAQLHYPVMESEYRRWWPADLLIEPINRSKTWMYLQIASSSAIFKKAPFKRAIGTGRVRTINKGHEIAKMLPKYGTDLIRYSLMSKEKPWLDRNLKSEVLNRSEKMFNRLWNLHRFVALYYSVSDFKAEEVSLETVHEYGMPVDRWMMSVLEESKDRYVREMESLRLDRALEVLESLINTVSEWYLKAVRTRIRSRDMSRREVLSGYRTLYEAIMVILRMLAPFSPYASEKMYQNIGGKELSVHGESLGTPNKLLIDRNLDVRMEIAMDIIRSGRKARKKAGISLRWPVERIVVKAASKEVVDAVDLFGDFIRESLNAQRIEVVPPAEEWGEMILEVQPNPDAIGMVYRQWSSRIAVMLKNRPAKRIREEIKKGEYYLGIEGQMVKIEPNMVKFVSSLPDYIAEEKFLDGSVYLDIRRSEELLVEGRMRELVRRIQDMRKDLKLSFMDYIDLSIAGNESIEDAVVAWGEEIADMTHAREIALTNEEGIEGEYLVEWYIEGEPVIIGIEPLYWEEMINVLSKMPGMNKQKSEAVFDAGYTNLALLLEASADDLSAIPSISPALAKKLRSYVAKNFSEGASLIKKGSVYECGVCGTILEEPADICPKCHLNLHLKEEKSIPEPSEPEKTEEKDEFMEKMAHIKGIGPSRARLLYESGYRSADDLKKAGIGEISKVKRMSRALAELLFKEFGIEEKTESSVSKEEKPDDEAKEEEMSEDEFLKIITKIKGLGPSRARKIYEAGYHSIEALRKADVKEISKIPRMSRALAEQIKDFVGSEEDGLKKEEKEETRPEPEDGGLYIFEKQEEAYSFAEDVKGRVESVLCLSRERPSEIKKRLQGAEAMQVSGSAKHALRPNELDKIALTLEKWMSEKGKKALITDVLDQLISENSFDSVLRFLDYLIDEGKQNGFFVILAFNLNSLPEEQGKILREKAN